MSPGTIDVGLHALDTVLALVTALLGVCVWFLRGISQRQDLTNDHLTETNAKLDNLAERIIRIEEWRDEHTGRCDERHAQHRQHQAHIEARLDAMLAGHHGGHA